MMKAGRERGRVNNEKVKDKMSVCVYVCEREKLAACKCGETFNKRERC